MSGTVTRVDLGFAEKCSPWQATSRLFPSKIGGKPAWLDLKNLPSLEELECKVCKQQMLFLCQVYAPFEEDDNNFHRTLFVFICKNHNCCINNTNENIKVFRSSLPRSNKFYSYDPPANEPDPDFKLSKWLKLCNLCGCLGEKKCSKCKTTIYCCREHQVWDWKDHKTYCDNNSEDSQQLPSTKLFQEFELVIEPEEIEEHLVDEEKELKKFENLQKEGKTGTLNEIIDNELEQHALVDNDKTFTHFRKQISQNPNQVLRYSKGGEILWITKEPKPLNIPNCEYCGSERQFEFQIMPQLLSVLHESDLDWGILLIYTCIKSCINEPNYKKEFIYKQDIVLQST